MRRMAEKSLPDLGKILSDSVEWRATAIQIFYKQLGGRAMGWSWPATLLP